MAKTGVMLKLDEAQLAALDVLCLHGSRAAYFQNLIPALAEQRAKLHELAIASFRESVRRANDAGEDPTQYMDMIFKWDAELTKLRGV